MYKRQVENIVFTASPDGSQTKITWPVVQGACGYLCSVYDVTNPEAPVVIGEMNNKLVDGCSIVVPRADDSNYMFSIKALGNTALNNKDAETATEVAFSSFVPAFAAIPSGTDLYEYFQNNPLLRVIRKSCLLTWRLVVSTPFRVFLILVATR